MVHLTGVVLATIHLTGLVLTVIHLTGGRHGRDTLNGGRFGRDALDGCRPGRDTLNGGHHDCTQSVAITTKDASSNPARSWRGILVTTVACQ